MRGKEGKRRKGKRKEGKGREEKGREGKGREEIQKWSVCLLHRGGHLILSSI